MTLRLVCVASHSNYAPGDRTWMLSLVAVPRSDLRLTRRRLCCRAAARLLMRLQHEGLTVVRQRLHSPNIPHPIAEALLGVEPGTAALSGDNPGELGELAGPHARALRSLLEGPAMAVELEGPGAVEKWHTIAKEMGRGQSAYSKEAHEGVGPFHGSATDAIAHNELRLLFD